jgi:putative ABC transport system permease protein
MKYLPLIWASLFRRKARTILTLLSIMVAFLLYGMLDTVQSTFAHAGQGVRGNIRLYTAAKVSGVSLPISLYADIEAVPGVLKTTYGSTLPATYRDPKNLVSIEAHPEQVFDLYPECEISGAELQAYRNTRTGAIIEEETARKYHWKVGDKIPFLTNIEQKNGSTVWIFDVVGIFRLPEPKEVLPSVMFHYELFDEARAFGRGTVDWYNVTVADTSQTDPVAHAIDAISANSSHETLTQSENAFFANLVGQVANVGLIVGAIMGAVFFTLILLTGNTMSQAVRERTAEVAILKTVGFTSRNVLSLILSESVLLLLLGSVLGLGLAASAIAAAHENVLLVFPTPLVAGNFWPKGLALAILIGLIVGAIPARRGLRLRIIDALSDR